jgi:hypothetical protein
MEEPTTPLAMVVTGGDELDADSGYGPPRLLRNDGVVAIADALEQVTEQQMADNLASCNFDEVYPYFGRYDEDVGVAPFVAEMRTFFRGAATDGAAVVTLLT